MSCQGESALSNHFYWQKNYIYMNLIPTWYMHKRWGNYGHGCYTSMKWMRSNGVDSKLNVILSKWPLMWKWCKSSPICIFWSIVKHSQKDIYMHKLIWSVFIYTVVECLMSTRWTMQQIYYVKDSWMLRQMQYTFLAIEFTISTST